MVLNCFVLFFTFNDSQQKIFSAMNFLVRDYGHNHYAAFLLLVLPIFWYQFFVNQHQRLINKKELSIFLLILLLSSYFIIIISLARLVLILVLMQLFLVFLFNKKNQNSQMSVPNKILIFVLTLLSLIYLFLSFSSKISNQNLFCPLLNKKEICQPFFQNDRFIYWKRALLVFKENLYFGCGLKNMNFSSRHVLISNYRFSSYAHNIFLHNLAELGVFSGGFFIFFILYLFYRSILLVKTENNNDNNFVNSFLLLAASSSLINAMFDFDWHFFVIFSLTLIFLAIILRDQDNNENAANNSRLIKYYVIVSLFSIFLLLANLFSSFLYSQDRFDIMARFFPYLSQQIRPLFIENKLSVDGLSSIYKFYKEDPDYLYKFSTLQGLESKKKFELQYLLSKLDPMFFARNVNLDGLDPQSSQLLASQLVSIVNAYSNIHDEQILDYWQQRKLSLQIFVLANQAYEEGNMDLSSDLYKKSIALDEYAAQNSKVAFLDDSNLQRVASFLKNFKDFDSRKMYRHFYQYISLYQKTLVELFINDQMDDFFVLADALFLNQSISLNNVLNILKNRSTGTEYDSKLEKVYNRFNSNSLMTY